MATRDCGCTEDSRRARSHDADLACAKTCRAEALTTDKAQARSLTDRQGDAAFAYTRVFKVLEVAVDLLQRGKQITLRELYYRLKGQSPVIASTRSGRLFLYLTESLRLLLSADSKWLTDTSA